MSSAARRYLPKTAIIPPLEQISDLREAGIVTWKMDARSRRVLSVSSNYFAEVGIDPTGRTPLEIFGPQTGRQITEGEDQAIATGIYSGPIVIPDGRIYHVMYRYSARDGLIRGLAFPLRRY